ncbi:DgyrCDS1035 [Dimorphilus gyrociliatus]|uniref:DgyrCDS1035 n=1 Tax=Dimorphilus gyrociliatus TaxID=2664684 RepID=A0A7I8V6E3_9ANNE|nr:DgyrCDS1035 [Dimorphilus gyrociliatus]
MPSIVRQDSQSNGNAAGATQDSAHPETLTLPAITYDEVEGSQSQPQSPVSQKMANHSLRGATSVGEISIDTMITPADTLMPARPYQLRESTLTVNYPDCGESKAKKEENEDSDDSDVREEKKRYISKTSGVINNGYAASTNSVATLAVNAHSLGESMLTVNYTDIPGIHNFVVVHLRKDTLDY